MKIRSFIFLVVVMAFGQQAALSQDPPPPMLPKPSPSPKLSEILAINLASVQPGVEVSRERREQAYAKLLEGQRYILTTSTIRKFTDLTIDCHLMIEEPGRYAVSFVEAGADMVSVHVEADVHLQRTLVAIREAGAKAGIAINPGTPLVALEEALPFADFVLLMSVNPGFGGQGFISTSVDKLERLRQMIRDRGLQTRIEIDGGIDAGNIGKIVESGAEIIVAGSAVFGGGQPTAAVAKLIEKATVWV